MQLGGPVAQLGERIPRTDEVRGSNPLRSTTVPAAPLLIAGVLLTSRLVMLAGMTAVLHGIPAAAVYMAGHFADAQWYHAIAAGGYAGGGAGPPRTAFYPGYPLLVALAAAPFEVLLPAGLLSAPAPPDTSVHDWLVLSAQLLVSNACLVVALVALWKLYRPRLGTTATLIGSCLLLAAPNAFFLSSGHSESAFLAAAALAFLLAERGRWVAAGLAAAAAALIRSPGILLLVPLAIIWLRSSRPRARALAGLAIALAGAAAFPAYTWAAFGDPLRYVHSEAYWHPSRTNPIATYVELLRRLWLGVREMLHVQRSPIDRWYSPRVQFLDGLMLLWATACTLLGRVPLGLAHVAWILLMLAFPLSAGGNPVSTNRYLLVAFPAFYLVGWWLRRRPVLAVPLVLAGMVAMSVLSGEAMNSFVG